MEEEIWVHAHKNMATKLAIKVEQKRGKKTTEDIIMEQYHHFIQDIFSEELFDKLPPWKPWDHMVKLVPDAQLINCKIYPLNPEEQKELVNSLKETSSLEG